jgi:hypothetical protein
MNIESLENQSILMFGKPRAFSAEEFALQISHHNLKIVEHFSDEVSLIVEGRMMSPYEQNKADALYEEKKIQTISIDVLEKALVEELDGDTLLMSLKLSHDKERLKSFIQNSCLSDALFFKLIKMYSWQNEDFFENDDNRDVSAAFILRFYENIQRNHNVQYATTGFIHLVSQTKSTELLSAIADLEPLQFHPKIMMAIAMSKYCDAKMQKKLAKKQDEKINEALSFNKYLITQLMEEFLKDEQLGKNIAASIEVNGENFKALLVHKYALAKNETLSVQMQEKLYDAQDDALLLALAHNNALDEKIIFKLLKSDNEELLETLFKNTALPKNIIEESYKQGLHHNAIAQNENTPVEILYQLQLDSRYERYVKTNAAFGQHIQSENIGWL